MQRPRYSIEKAYPELFEGDEPLLAWQDVERARTFLTDEAHLQVKGFRDHIKTYEYNGRDYDMFFMPGTCGRTLVSSAEVATDFPFRRDRITQALAIRAMVDPCAALMLQPQSALTLRSRSRMNFSPKEKKLLAEGDSTPIIGRMRETLITEGRLKSRIHAFGSSLGATIVTDLAAQIPVRSLTTLEAPDIKERTCLQLANDMRKSGPHFLENYQHGKLDTKTRLLHQGPETFAYWALSLLHSDNWATIQRLGHNTHEANLAKAVQKNPRMGVMRAWAAESFVSPANENRAITKTIQGHPGIKHHSKIEEFELTSEFASHNSSNIPILLAALVRRAMKLSEMTRTT